MPICPRSRSTLSSLVVTIAALGCSAPPREPARRAPERGAATATAVATGPAPDPQPGPGKVSAPQSAVGSDWTTFHGDAQRTGQSSAPPIKKPKILWKARVGIQGWLNGPVVLGSTVFVPSSGSMHNAPDAEDGVHALDVKTGKRVFFTKLDRDANGIAVTADAVFVTSDDGHLYALDVQSGKVLWKRRGTGKMYAQPLLVGGRVVVADSTGMVRAYAAKDGKEQWQAQLSGAVRGGASADAERIYVATVLGDVAAFGPDGTLVWKQAVTRPPFDGRGRPVPVEVYAAPVVTEDLVVLTFARDTYYGETPALVALDKRDGRVLWRGFGQGNFGNVRSTPVLVDGALVYGEPYSGDVVAIGARNGTALYRKTIGPCYFPQWASPAAAGTTVYLPRFDGALYAIDASSGEVQWSLYLGDSREKSTSSPPSPGGRTCAWEVPSGFSLFAPPAIASDGTVFIGSEEGFVYAVGEDRR